MFFVLDDYKLCGLLYIEKLPEQLACHSRTSKAKPGPCGGDENYRLLGCCRKISAFISLDWCLLGTMYFYSGTKPGTNHGTSRTRGTTPNNNTLNPKETTRIEKIIRETLEKGEEKGETLTKGMTLGHSKKDTKQGSMP